MQINIDRFELLYLLEGAARGSHLRQGIWRRAVDEFYDKLTPNERLAVYMYAKRDLTEIFAPIKLSNGETYQHFGAEHFFQFLACYNPANRYSVHVKGNADGKEFDEWVDAYLWNDIYYTKFYVSIAKEYVVKAEQPKLNDKYFKLCNFTACMWHDNCARYDGGNLGTGRIGIYANSKCDWFINKDTEHGADLKHFEV